MEEREQVHSAQPKTPLRQKTLAPRRKRQHIVSETPAAANDNPPPSSSMRTGPKPMRPYIPPFMRSANYFHLSAPDYGKFRFLYTIKMHHGGRLCGIGTGRTVNLGYLGGTITTFDFVDVTRANVAYLDNLVEKIGYSGPKVYYGLGKSGRLESINGSFDIEQIFNVVVDRVHYKKRAFYRRQLATVTRTVANSDDFYDGYGQMVKVNNFSDGLENCRK